MLLKFFYATKVITFSFVGTTDRLTARLTQLNKKLKRKFTENHGFSEVIPKGGLNLLGIRRKIDLGY